MPVQNRLRGIVPQGQKAEAAILMHKTGAKRTKKVPEFPARVDVQSRRPFIAAP
jgi:hypothetical protein